MSRYSSKGVPWGSGIGKDVSDCTTSQEVMEKAGLNFTVEKCELVSKMPFTLNGDNNVNSSAGEFIHRGHIYRDCPNAYGTYRTDKNLPLGLVKLKYEVVQNRDAFKFFDDAIGEGKAKWDRAGYFGYGHKIFVSAKLPFETVINGDKIDNYLVFGNTHDGSSSVNILFSPIRVICTNMLNSAMRNADSFIRLRHTKKVNEKIQRGAEILKIACEHAKHSQQLYEALTKINVSDDEVMNYIASLCLNDAEKEALALYNPKSGFKKLFHRDYATMENTEISMRKVNKMISIFDYYQDGIGQQNIVGTAWGAYNAVTGYYCNVANLDGEKRVDSLLYGSSFNDMSKALNIAYNEEYKLAI